MLKRWFKDRELVVIMIPLLSKLNTIMRMTLKTSQKDMIHSLLSNKKVLLCQEQKSKRNGKTTTRTLPLEFRKIRLLLNNNGMTNMLKKRKRNLLSSSKHNMSTKTTLRIFQKDSNQFLFTEREEMHSSLQLILNWSKRRKILDWKTNQTRSKPFKISKLKKTVDLKSSKTFSSMMKLILMKMIPKTFPSIKTQVPMTNTTPRCGTIRSINRPLPSRLILKNKLIKKTRKEKLMTLPRRRSTNKKSKLRKWPRNSRKKRRQPRNNNWLR